MGLQLVFGLMIALVLNQRFKGRGILRAIVFAPWAVSGVLTSMMWSLMYNENDGVVNDLLMKWESSRRDCLDIGLRNILCSADRRGAVAGHPVFCHHASGRPSEHTG